MEIYNRVKTQEIALTKGGFVRIVNECHRTAIFYYNSAHQPHREDGPAKIYKCNLTGEVYCYEYIQRGISHRIGGVALMWCNLKGWEKPKFSEFELYYYKGESIPPELAVMMTEENVESILFQLDLTDDEDYT